MKYWIIFFSLLFIGHPSEARKVDYGKLFQCNDYFCPGRNDNPADEALRERVGIVVPPTPNFQYIERRIVLDTQGETRPTRTPRQAPSEIGTSPRSTPEETTSERENTNADNNNPNGMQPFQLASKGAPTQAAQPMNQASAGNGNPEVRNGVPVRRESSGGNIEQSGAFGKGQATQGLNPSKLNAVDINNNNINSGDDGDLGISPASVASGRGVGLPNSPGQFESGSGTTVPGKGGGFDKSLDKLGKLAKKMGKSFFGGLSKIAGNNKFGQTFARLSKRFGKGAAGKGTEYAGLAGGKNLNLKKFVPGGNRIPASMSSGSEYYDEKSFMFNNLCSNFLEIGRREKITVNLAGCPK